MSCTELYPSHTLHHTTCHKHLMLGGTKTLNVSFLVPHDIYCIFCALAPDLMQFMCRNMALYYKDAVPLSGLVPMPFHRHLIGPFLPNQLYLQSPVYILVINCRTTSIRKRIYFILKIMFMCRYAYVGAGAHRGQSVRFPWNWSHRQLQVLSVVCQGLNSGPLQYFLLITELFLQLTTES